MVRQSNLAVSETSIEFVWSGNMDAQQPSYPTVEKSGLRTPRAVIGGGPAVGPLAIQDRIRNKCLLWENPHRGFIVEEKSTDINERLCLWIWWIILVSIIKFNKGRGVYLSWPHFLTSAEKWTKTIILKGFSHHRNDCHINMIRYSKCLPLLCHAPFERHN